MENKLIEFIRKKDYKFIKEIGQGGTGRTVLLKDEQIDEHFVCKKYSPVYDGDKETYFKNFVDEIKLLHLLFHRNIVRVFNYHLYPKKQTGYILMEYIQGPDIEAYLNENPDKINSVFNQTIEGFKYLEGVNILHRDIRPSNILVSNDDVVKIIDFGFGKKIEFNDSYGKSISLNWLYTTPDEFDRMVYDFRTEIYFVAKLFESIIIKNKISGFAYNDILKSMTLIYENRIKSFFEVSRKITEGSNFYDEFNEYEKEVYRRFAEHVIPIFASMNGTQTYVSDLNKIISDLENIYQSSMLEDNVQNIVDITRVFVKGGYKYWTEKNVPVAVVKEFVNFFRALPLEKQKIVLNHIWRRLDAVKREIKEENDLPF